MDNLTITIFLSCAIITYYILLMHALLFTTKQKKKKLTNHQIAGQRLKQTLLARDPDYYKKIGSIGGKKARTTPRGFAAMSESRHKSASSKGGKTTSSDPIVYS